MELKINSFLQLDCISRDKRGVTASPRVFLPKLDWMVKRGQRGVGFVPGGGAGIWPQERMNWRWQLGVFAGDALVWVCWTLGLGHKVTQTLCTQEAVGCSSRRDLAPTGSARILPLP